MVKWMLSCSMCIGCSNKLKWPPLKLRDEKLELHFFFLCSFDFFLWNCLHNHFQPYIQQMALQARSVQVEGTLYGIRIHIHINITLILTIRRITKTRSVLRKVNPKCSIQIFHSLADFQICFILLHQKKKWVSQHHFSNG